MRASQPLFPIYTINSVCMKCVQSVSRENNLRLEPISQTHYFFPVFFPVFFVDFFVVFSSFFCMAFTEATFFTIFCSSIRNARRMLFNHLHLTHSPITNTFMAQISAISTSYRTLRYAQSSHITTRDTRNLS